MARGIRRSTLEKLNDEMASTQAAIEQYKSCLNTLKEKEEELRAQIEIEELKSVSEFLKEQNMSVKDLKDLIQSQTINQKQSA